MSDVTVFGATGFTGKLVCKALADMNLSFTAAGRNEKKLSELKSRYSQGVSTHVASVDDKSSLKKMCSECKVIINCVGPFGVYGEPVVKAAIEAGCHYLDTTGEQAFMRNLFDHYDEKAKRAGVTVVPSMAYEVALSDCGAFVAGQGLDGKLRISVAYAWEFLAASQGTMRSAMRVFGGDGWGFRDGKFVPEKMGKHIQTFDFGREFGKRTGVSFPSAEVLTIPRHQNAGSVAVYFCVSPLAARLSRFAGPLFSILRHSTAKPLVENYISKSPEGPSEKLREKQKFGILILAQGQDTGRVHRMTIIGKDPYGITGVISALAAKTFLEKGPLQTGVLAPAESIDTNGFLKGLAAYGIRVEQTESGAR